MAKDLIATKFHTWTDPETGEEKTRATKWMTREAYERKQKREEEEKAREEEKRKRRIQEKAREEEKSQKTVAKEIRKEEAEKIVSWAEKKLSAGQKTVAVEGRPVRVEKIRDFYKSRAEHGGMDVWSYSYNPYTGVEVERVNQFVTKRVETTPATGIPPKGTRDISYTDPDTGEKKTITKEEQNSLPITVFEKVSITGVQKTPTKTLESPDKYEKKGSIAHSAYQVGKFIDIGVSKLTGTPMEKTFGARRALYSGVRGVRSFTEIPENLFIAGASVIGKGEQATRYIENIKRTNPVAKKIEKERRIISPSYSVEGPGKQPQAQVWESAGEIITMQAVGGAVQKTISGTKKTLLWPEKTRTISVVEKTPSGVKPVRSVTHVKSQAGIVYDVSSAGGFRQVGDSMVGAMSSKKVRTAGVSREIMQKGKKSIVVSADVSSQPVSSRYHPTVTGGKFVSPKQGLSVGETTTLVKEGYQYIPVKGKSIVIQKSSLSKNLGMTTSQSIKNVKSSAETASRAGLSGRMKSFKTAKNIFKAQKAGSSIGGFSQTANIRIISKGLSSGMVVTPSIPSNIFRKGLKTEEKQKKVVRRKPIQVLRRKRVVSPISTSDFKNIFRPRQKKAIVSRIDRRRGITPLQEPDISSISRTSIKKPPVPREKETTTSKTQPKPFSPIPPSTTASINTPGFSFPMLPPLGFNIGLGIGKGRSGFRVPKDTKPSLKAIVKGIRGKKFKTPKSGATGLELRPLPKKRKSKDWFKLKI